MLITTKILVLRNLRMRHVAAFFSDIGATSVAHDLRATIQKGKEIIRILNKKYLPNQSLVNSLTADLLGQIEGYLKDGQCAIEVAGIVKESERCETEEILCDLKDESLVLLRYLGQSINSPQLIKK